MRALVVDDTLLIRVCIRDLLEEAGFECAEAADAEEALALIDSESWVPDLLVSDYDLGPGPNGIALAAEVLRRRPDLPVLFVTGNPECFDGRIWGPREHLLAKPFLPDNLIEAAARLVEPPRHGTALKVWLAQRSVVLVPG
jgi:two-component system, OmpR family, response regulator